jgi:GTP cyclohydrolase I
VATTLSDIIPILEDIAPPSLAEEWDNVGFQIGDLRSKVRSLWVALDPGEDVVAAACQAGVDLLVTHHPLFFRPVKQIDVGSPLGGVVERLIRHRLAVYSMHTNLDAVHGGLNDWLAHRLGLRQIRPLLPNAGSAQPSRHGLGRVGMLKAAMHLKDLALEVKRRLTLNTVRVAGDAMLRVKRVALSTGSGGSLSAAFLASDAEVFISGDLRYHDARDIEAAERGLIDVGHFHSEHLMTAQLAQCLRRAFDRRRIRIRVEACPLEHDPFSVA